jgi:hypothetical protein
MAKFAISVVVIAVMSAAISPTLYAISALA